MSEGEEYQHNGGNYSDDEENNAIKRIRSVGTPIFKTGTSMGMRRSQSMYTPKTQTPFLSRSMLRPLSSSEILILPFKPLKITNNKIGGGGLRPGTSLGVRRTTQVNIHSLHDPNDDEAFVLYRPKVSLSEDERLAWVGANPGKPPEFEVEVVVDPVLSKVLRPHQKEGVQFLYDCTTGQKDSSSFGCIMADEMGLGKTLQCITLLWTLLRQSPTPGRPTIEKAIIACPSSLVKNWANELKKWLGEGRVRPFACDNKGTKEETTKSIKQFGSSKGRGIVNPVLIISYETLRSYCDELKKTEVGLLLCDEGHRLKNSESRTYKSLNELSVKSRVILSGTPIQNDLTEYFSLLTFVIPDVLGTGADFRKKFELPILRGRDVDASDKDRQRCEECLQELAQIANRFIIRRTAELLTKYLPTKYEYIVFCRLKDFQKRLYEQKTSSELRRLSRLDGIETNSKGGQSTLKAMNVMKKIVNHPALLTEDDIQKVDEVPTGFQVNECIAEFSGKFEILESILIKIRTETTDKIVLISNYTQTLDMMDQLFKRKRWPFCRLDGSMTIPKRAKIVDKFNDPEQPEFIFLLSSKAGGCGINLIGANRLILFDPDWNPYFSLISANDAQALARVWRDGQKKTSYIYRFIATGTIEEKIFQRQAHKQSLSSCVVDEEQDVERHFSLEALRQLFQYNDKTDSDTHDTFKCKRCKDGRQIIKPTENTVNAGASATDTSTWNHFGQQEFSKIFDRILREESVKRGIISFVFQNKSHDGFKVQ